MQPRVCERAARRVLRRPAAGGAGSSSPRSIPPSDGLAVREAHPRLQRRRHPRVPEDHRCRAPPRRTDLRSDQPQRRAGVVDVHAVARLGPVAVADPLFREVPHAVSEAEIAEIVAGYALVARHCRQGGFDGIELQCSHSSIVRGFLSSATNLRTDRYGGSLEAGRRCCSSSSRRCARRSGPDWRSACGSAVTSSSKAGRGSTKPCRSQRWWNSRAAPTTSTPRSEWRRRRCS